MRRRAYWLVAAVAAAAGIGVVPVAAQEPALSRQVAAVVAAFRKTGSPHLGISVVDLRSGEVLVDVDSTTPLIPASNQKLLTSAFALAQLGQGYQFTTSVYRRGGDILIRGDGDPMLGDPVLAASAGGTIYDELDRWVDAIHQTAGASIGDLLLCVAWPSGPGRHPDWPRDQRHRWYAAPPASLNFNDNCFDVALAVADGSVEASVQPESRFVGVDNQVTVGTKQVWSGRTSEDDSVLTLTGTISRSTTEPLSIAVNQPPLLLGRALAEQLARAGVTVNGTIRIIPESSIDWSATQQIAQTATPLATVLARSNKRSLNMVAECLFLRAGDGTWDGSAELMLRTLREVYGVDTTGLVVRDGGGLSRGNRVSAGTLATLLGMAPRRPGGTMLIESLPISGTDGTMQNRLAEPAYRGRVLGKTGYIAGVSALSGYVLDEDGKPAMAFSILINDAPSARKAREFQDSICRLLVDSLRPAASRSAGR